MEETILNAIKELSQLHPLHLFATDELSFYKKYFNHFSAHVIREKKILVFENPNRMKVTYEFDVQGIQKTNDPLFIFLPNTRKNWLKIMWEGRRLSVCSAEEVKNSVKTVVQNGLDTVVQSLGEMDKEGVWNKKIWGSEERLPCFISGESLEGDGQLVVEFYDSFENFKQTCGLFGERSYTYDYALEAGRSHWIYVKAPERFQIALTANDSRANVIKGNDPEIKAYGIFHDKENIPVKFQIDVKVPQTLKWWYRTIVILSVAFVIVFGWLGFSLIHKKALPLTPAFAQVGISLVAAIIATRGWIMNDETVLKRVSNIMTIFSILILLLLVLIYSIAGFVVNAS